MKRVVVLGVAGPDGSGKSSAVRAVVERLEATGVRVRSAYLYGCVVCRRAGRGAGHDPRARTGQRPGRLALSHALIDLAELVLRRGFGVAGLMLTPGAGPRVLVTDRTPLDGLAKHDPPAASLVTRAYRRAAHGFDRLFQLDAPPDVLAARDREHSAAELAGWRERFSRWRGELGGVVVLDTAAMAPSSIAARIVEGVPGVR